MKYDKRSINSTINFISTEYSIRFSTLEKRGKRGKVTKYWMATINGTVKFFYKLSDLKKLVIELV